MKNQLIGPMSPEQPALVEAEVIRLRHECAQILQELEGRVHHLIELPRRFQDQVRAIERGVVSFLRRNAPIIIGIGAAVVVGTVAEMLLRPRRRRPRTLLDSLFS